MLTKKQKKQNMHNLQMVLACQGRGLIKHKFMKASHAVWRSGKLHKEPLRVWMFYME